MSKYHDQLADKDQTIKIMKGFTVCLFVLVLFAMSGWAWTPTKMVIHIPPDISSGASVKPGEVGKSHVYSFTHYLWQQLNRWDSDGLTDYHNKIESLRAYLTPNCYQNRMEDFERKKKNNELRNRSRFVREIPGRTYSESRVTVNAANKSWTVSLDLHIEESMLGERIKDRFVNYPISVVRYNVDPEKNPWQLAIDCLADSPTVIEVAS